MVTHMAESCAALDRTAGIQAGISSGQSRAVQSGHQCSQVPLSPCHSHSLGTCSCWDCCHPSPLAPSWCLNGAWEGAALPWHHQWSQEGCPDLPPTPEAWRLLAGPAGTLEAGIAPEQWQNRLKARIVFPYCTLHCHYTFLVLSFLF